MWSEVSEFRYGVEANRSERCRFRGFDVLPFRAFLIIRINQLSQIRLYVYRYEKQFLPLCLKNECVHLGCLHCFGFRLKVCENDLDSNMKYSKYYTFLRMVKFEIHLGLNC